MENVNPYESPDADLDTGQQQSYQPKVFAINGRLGRARYLCYSAAITMLAIIVMGVLAAVFGAVDEGGELSPLISLLILFPIAGTMVIMARRRFHDLNFSGWWSITVLIPILSIIPGLFLMFAPGNKHENDYGLMPNKNGASIYIVMGFFIIMLVGIIAAVALPAYQAYTNGL
ncbi:MAG: DUF805 domain-containing protein [Algicola sp.]|nr:DUF805 domain-containing protein [Algicola sp.]